jgi:hypothetical protein
MKERPIIPILEDFQGKFVLFQTFVAGRSGKEWIS